MLIRIVAPFCESENLQLVIKVKCSIFVLMRKLHFPRYPKPPSACPVDHLPYAATADRICVAGLVILRQRPGTAKGVIFITLEDETGTINIVVWRKVYEQFRRAILSARLMRVTGHLQREEGVTHVIAREIEDISPLLDHLLTQDKEQSASHFA